MGGRNPLGVESGIFPAPLGLGEDVKADNSVVGAPVEPVEEIVVSSEGTSVRVSSPMEDSTDGGEVAVGVAVCGAPASPFDGAREVVGEIVGLVTGLLTPPGGVGMSVSLPDATTVGPELTDGIDTNVGEMENSTTPSTDAGELVGSVTGLPTPRAGVGMLVAVPGTSVIPDSLDAIGCSEVPDESENSVGDADDSTAP